MKVTIHSEPQIKWSAPECKRPRTSRIIAVTELISHVVSLSGLYITRRRLCSSKHNLSTELCSFYCGFAAIWTEAPFYLCWNGAGSNASQIVLMDIITQWFSSIRRNSGILWSIALCWRTWDTLFFVRKTDHEFSNILIHIYVLQPRGMGGRVVGGRGARWGRGRG